MRRSFFPKMFVALALASMVGSIAVERGIGASHPGRVALPADLVRAMEAYDRATTHNDVAALATLVTDDYMLVNSDLSVQGKQSYLADFAKPGFRLEPYRMEQPFHIVRADSALTGGIFQLDWTQDGQKHSRRLRIAHFWLKQGTHWRITYTQLTRAPE